jgi:hypothetical protein
MWPCISLSLSFLFYNMRILLVKFHGVIVRVKLDNAWKEYSTWHVESAQKCSLLLSSQLETRENNYEEQMLHKELT